MPRPKKTQDVKLTNQKVKTPTSEKLDRLKVAHVVTHALSGALEQVEQSRKTSATSAAHIAHAHAQAAQVLLDVVQKGQFILAFDKDHAK